MVYPESGDRWVDAATTRAEPAPILTSTLQAEAEVARFAASGRGRRGVSLRMGGLYGPGLASTMAMLKAARRGMAQMFGPAHAFTPMVWIEDAATALLTALERAPSGVYDVTDDGTLTRGDVTRELAKAVGRSRVLLPPRWLARFAAGPAAAAFANSQRVSNRRFAEATGWAPAVADARVGLRRLSGMPGQADSIVPTSGDRRVALILLGFLVAFLLSAGIWELFFPAHFYHEFPGFGRAWVSVDGPYNEHLVRDFGSANLALGLIGLGLLLRPAAYAVRVFAAGVFVAQTAHFAYHAAHLSMLPTVSDRILQTLSLAIVVLVPALLVIVAGQMDAQARTRNTPIALTDAPGQGAPRLIANRQRA
jgi:hypothetical protein